ncbi:glycosyltransferase family 39 protein [Pseudomonas cedrina subsp. fulgida]|nr:glycosyltransferase family 39 protein [Pseudomonas cedrina subsp. fulgida]
MSTLLPHLRWLRALTGWGDVLAVLLFATLLRAYKLTEPSLWSDEGFSLELITYSPSEIWVLSGRDVHPPLYYLVLKAWVEWVGGNGLGWTRGLSAGFGVITVGLGIWLTRLICTRQAAIIAGVLLAALPIAVRYSQDVRMYAMLGALTMGATIALMYWVMYPSKTRYRVIYAVLMVAALYTHYFSIFCAASHWLYLLLIRFPRNGGLRFVGRRDWWLTNALIAALYIPWLPSIFEQLGRFGPGWVLPLTPYSVPSVVWKFLTGQDGRLYDAYLFWSLPLVYLLVLILLLFKEGGRYKFHWLLCICAVLTITVVAVYSLRAPIFVERYLFFSALMLPLVLAVMMHGAAKAVTAVVLVAVLGIEAVGLNHIYRQQHALNNPYRIADNQLDRLMDYFNKASIEGDVLVVGDVYTFYTAKFYKRDRSPLLLYTPVKEDGMSGRPSDLNFDAPMMKYPDSTYVDDLCSLNSRSGRVWLLVFSHQMPGAIEAPGSWRLIHHEPGGDNLLNLYAPLPLQAATTSNASKLSARAICHMRE